MLDDYFTRREILRRHRAGLFGAHLDTYTSTLTELQYRPDTVRSHCYLFRIFGRWLKQRRMRLVDLNEEVITSFWRKERGRQWRVKAVGLKPMQRMLVQLRSQGVVPKPTIPKPSDAAALAGRFGEYLVERRSLQPVTVDDATRVVRQFIEDSFGRGPVRLHALGEKDITRFPPVSKTGETADPGIICTKPGGGGSPNQCRNRRARRPRWSRPRTTIAVNDAASAPRRRRAS